MRLRLQVPRSVAAMVLADMRSAGYDVTPAETTPGAETQELTLWIFAGQSALQAELLLKRLAPTARLINPH